VAVSDDPVVRIGFGQENTDHSQAAGFVGHVNLEAAAAADQVDTIDALSSNISYIDHDCQGPNP
jgi:hypothetical protein